MATIRQQLSAICISVIIFVADLSFLSSSADLSPIISTKHGSLRGKLIRFDNNEQLQDVYEFTGIPFAEPPLGEKRFQKPVPKTPWDDVLEATKPPPACIQALPPFESGLAKKFALVPGTELSEDCLYLNLWVPKKVIDNKNKVAKNLATFIFIHGGGWISGAPMVGLYNGSVLASHGDVIVAKIAYRVGTLGFSFFGTEDTAGNVGLWDQHEAIKWIYENVNAFGGDANKITVGGQSAGGVSVTTHAMTPYTRKYFQRGIIESGTATSPWAFYRKEDATSRTEKVASAIAGGKCSQLATSSSEQLACLRSLPAEEFPMADFAFPEYGFGSAPMIDGDYVAKDPREMLMEGDFPRIPWLLGATKDEGAFYFFLHPEAMEVASLGHQPDFAWNMSHYKRLVEVTVNLLTASPKPVDPLIVRLIELLYWPENNGDLPNSHEFVHAAGQASGDYAFTCPTFLWAEVESKRESSAPIFAYYFTHQSSTSFFPDWMSAVHTEEIAYLFGQPLTPLGKALGYTEDEEVLSRTVMLYFANFVKTGDPNADRTCDLSGHQCEDTVWPQFSDENCHRQIFEMNLATMVSKTANPITCGRKVRECQFWDEAFQRLVAGLEAKSD